MVKSTYTTGGQLSAVLHFGFQAAATDYVKGGDAAGPARFYDGDDGDEQGFIGRGGDKHARQDMLPAQVEAWAEQEGVDGEPLGTEAHLDPQAPLYQLIAELSRLREEHRALSEGAQITRLAKGDTGVFAVSRILVEDGVEHLVLVNNDVEARTVTVPTGTPEARYEPLLGEVEPVQAGADGAVQVSVPPVCAVLLQADRPVVEVTADAHRR